MDIQYYQQEFAHFTDWLIRSGKSAQFAQMQEIMWQAWLARAEQPAKKLATTRDRTKGRMICMQILNRLNAERSQRKLE